MIIDLEQTKVLAKKLNDIYGYNILNYDLAFVQRTIIKFSDKHNCKDFASIEKLLLGDEILMEQFFDKLFINVSEMFRDPSVFKVIREKIIPYISSYPVIKIWSAGCATGQEAYSLAILLKEFGVYDRAIIYATDVDAGAIKKANDGVYSLKDGLNYFENYYLSGGQERFNRYFDIKNNELRIKDELKENICFATHNIVTDDVFNEFSLILCRNMFIYFDSSLQSKALNIFKHSLERNSFLVLGKSESIHFNGGYRYFDNFDEKNKIYKKKREN